MSNSKFTEQSDASCRPAEIPGVGPITASALVASAGDAQSFENRRNMALDCAVSGTAKPLSYVRPYANTGLRRMK